MESQVGFAGQNLHLIQNFSNNSNYTGNYCPQQFSANFFMLKCKCKIWSTRNENTDNPTRDVHTLLRYRASEFFVKQQPSLKNENQGIL